MLKALIRNLFASRLAPSQKEVDTHALQEYFDRAKSAENSGDFAGAESCLQVAVSCFPLSSSSHIALASLLYRSGRLDESARAFHDGVNALPNDAMLRFSYAQLLTELHQPAAAKSQYQELIKAFPNWAPSYVNLALLELDQNLPQAESLLRTAVSLEPSMIEARTNLAFALKKSGRLSEALEEYTQVLAQQPQYEAALQPLLAIHQVLGDPTEAENWLSMDAQSERSTTCEVIATITIPSVLESKQHAIDIREKLTQRIEHLTQHAANFANPVKEIGVTPFYLAYHNINDRNLMETISKLYRTLCPTLNYTPPRATSCLTNSRTRIGIMSAYLYNHSIGNVMEGLIENLDKRKFSVHIFMTRAPFDDNSFAIARNADEWIVVDYDFEKARHTIEKHEVDVLFFPEVGMDPLTYFLAFCRLAPVQCTTWGHPVTTGISTIDYYISTNYFEPDDSAEHYSEQLVTLTDVALPGLYRKPRIPSPERRERLGFDAKGRVYFCPQALFKIHPDFDLILGEILRRDSAGKVYLVADSKKDEWRLRTLRTRFSRTIPDVAANIVFLPFAPTRDGYLQRILASDVILDTLHYCGGNTSLEAISAGTPVITMPSTYMRSRHTYGFFRKMGLMDTVAFSASEYADLAVKVATNDDLRAHIQRRYNDLSKAIYDDLPAVTQIQNFFSEVTAR